MARTGGGSKPHIEWQSSAEWPWLSIRTGTTINNAVRCSIDLRDVSRHNPKQLADFVTSGAVTKTRGFWQIQIWREKDVTVYDEENGWSPEDILERDRLEALDGTEEEPESFKDASNRVKLERMEEEEMERVKKESLDELEQEVKREPREVQEENDFMFPEIGQRSSTPTAAQKGKGIAARVSCTTSLQA